MSDARLVEDYLKGEPLDEETARSRRAKVAWYGTSDRKNNQAVKELCQGSDPDRKFTTFRILGEGRYKTFEWGTISKACLPKLIASGLWLPDGLDDDQAREVAVRVQRELDENESRQKAKLDADDEKHRALVAQRAEDARIKAEALRKQQVGGGKFTDEDYARAWERWQLPREIVDASIYFACLGPSNSKPIIRLEIQFVTSKKPFEVARGEVIEEYNRRFGDANTEPSAAAAPAKRKKREAAASASTDCGDDDVFARLQADNAKRMREAAAVAAAAPDPWKVALDRILERQRLNGVSIQLPILTTCPECDCDVDDQHLECSCDTADVQKWYVCKSMNMIRHATKQPCGCCTGPI